MASAGGDENPALKQTKTFVRSVLMSSKDGVVASRFLRDYQDITGEDIQFRKMGFSSLPDFMKSIPDAACVRSVGGQVTYFAVADDATRHIQSLIQRQKSNPKKNKSLKMGHTRIPKYHSNFSRSMTSRGGGGYRPSFRPPTYKVSGFAHPRPFTTPRAKSPMMPSSPFDSADVSPLVVTVRSRAGWTDDERTIARQGGSGVGRQMAQSALKAVVKERKMFPTNKSSYVLPPRFQRNQSGSGHDSDVSSKPVAGVTKPPNGCEALLVSVVTGPAAQDPRVVALDSEDVVQPSPHANESQEEAVSEDSLPPNAKSWATKLLKDYASGLWSTRFHVLYKEKFKAEAPANLMAIVQTWTDVIKTEKNEVAKRYVLYPADERSLSAESIVTPPVRARSPQAPRPSRPVSVTPPQSAPSSQSGPQWQNFIVPLAHLLEVREWTEVYASHSFDLRHFFLQREDSCAEDITERLLQLHQDLAVPRASDLQPGVFCAALYSVDSNWYRARVLYVHQDQTQVQVMFVDYGNAETVDLSDIRCLTQETADTPAQAVGCVMFALKPLPAETEWSDAAKEKFGELMADQKLHAYTLKIEEGNCVVELWCEENATSLNEQLFNLGLVDTYLPKNVEPPELELSQDGGFVEVVVAFVDLTNCWLRLIGPDYSEKLEVFENELGTIYANAEEDTKPMEEDSVCIAHAELLFHRVKIKELRDNQANCFFLDHGYTEWFPLDQVVPLTVEVNKSLPYQAVQCVLMGLEDHMSTTTTMTELVERSRNKICVAEFTSRDPLSVMLFDTHGNDDVNINEEIARKLIAEGQALDLAPFSASAAASVSDSLSETSRASSPRPSAGSHSSSSAPPAAQPDVDSLQSAAQRLTLSVPGRSQARNGSSDKDDASPSPSPSPSPSGRKIVGRTPNNELDGGDGAVSSSDVESTNTVVSPAAVSSSSVVSPGGGGVASPYSDSLCVAYNTWPLPSYVPQPEVGQFFDVYVQSASDPSNFVIVPHNVLGMLEKMMENMNGLFDPEMAMILYGETSAVKTPTAVPDPLPGHLYMAYIQGVFCRVVYIKDTHSLRHVLLPDYCEHELIAADSLCFLPKQFWSIPFAAFRASLHGVKPAGSSSEDVWTETAKYTFLQLTLHKTLVALLKGVEEVKGGPGVKDALRVSKQCMSLLMVDTSDPVTDVVVADHLLASGYGVAPSL